MDDFFDKLEISESEAMSKVKNFRFDDDDDLSCAKDLLLDLARAENFSVVFVDLHKMFGAVKVLVQVHFPGSGLPVFVASGSGSDRG